MSEELEKRIAKLEMIISYQEQIFDDLNDVVLAQQKQIDVLGQELHKFQQTLLSLGEEPNDRPPPQY